MDFNFSDEQQLLADTVRRFVRENYSFEARREILRSPPGWSRDVWNELAGLGLTALNVPEAHGGLGADSGRHHAGDERARAKACWSSPISRAAVLSPALLAQLTDSVIASQLFPAIASGERIVVVAHQEPHTRGEINHVATRAEKSGSDYILDGHKCVIAHGDTADELLVSASTGGQTRR